MMARRIYFCWGVKVRVVGGRKSKGMDEQQGLRIIVLAGILLDLQNVLYIA